MVRDLPVMIAAGMGGDSEDMTIYRDGALPIGPPVDLIGDPGRPGRAALRGRFVSLAPVDVARDSRPLFDCSHGSEAKSRLWTYMPYGPFADEPAMRGWLGERAASEDPLFLTVIDNASGRGIGMASFLNVVPEMRRLELGHIWYGPAVQRSKVNTEAAYLMLSEAFDRLAYRRVEWKCDALNERSRRTALRLGFTFEGVFRQHMIVKGHNRDTAWYALLDHEWPAVKRAMERWLYEVGCDASGRPSVSLDRLRRQS